MFVFKAAVVGAGTMGGQIAQTIAAAGIPVVLKDIGQDLVDAGLAEARRVTAGAAAKLAERGRLTQEQAAEQVVGFHYFYPASVMPLIEVIQGDETSPETVQAAVSFAQAIRKNQITCAE